MAFLMLVAVGAHLKVNGPLRCAAPAISLLARSVIEVVVAALDSGA